MLASQQLGQQTAERRSGSRNVISLVFHPHLLLGLSVLDTIDLIARLALSLMSWLRSFQVVAIALASDKVTVITIIPNATSSTK
jgi:hypothetical protein